MKKAIGVLIVACAFSMAAAVAQTATDPSQGNPSASPSTDQSTTTSQPQTMPSQPQSGPAQTDPATGQPPATDADAANKTNKTLRGCVQSQGGQYVLESKKGKAVALTGEDVSAHVGHEVSLKGTWETGSSGTEVSTPSSASSEKTFKVASVEMISDSCSGKARKGNSGDMGASPDSTTPGTGSTTNPPQH